MNHLETLLQEKAKSGYLVCFHNCCQRHEQCLRWQVAQRTDPELRTRTVVNPLNRLVAEGNCPMFRDATPLRMPLGMLHFYLDMPGRLERRIKGSLISDLSRTNYYRYHSGHQPIPPDVERLIRDTCRSCGWNEEPRFDAYIDDYVW